MDLNDPRLIAGLEFPAYRPGVSGEVWWKVIGWNSGGRGGSCTYEGVPTKAHAIDMLKKYRANGDGHGRRFENWDVLEIVFSVSCVTTVHAVSSD